MKGRASSCMTPCYAARLYGCSVHESPQSIAEIDIQKLRRPIEFKPIDRIRIRWFWCLPVLDDEESQRILPAQCRWHIVDSVGISHTIDQERTEMRHVSAYQVEVEARVALARRQQQCLSRDTGDDAQPLEIGFQKVAD